MERNTRRDSHVEAKYFLLRLTSITDWFVEIGAEDDLGVMFVTSIPFSVGGLWLLT